MVEAHMTVAHFLDDCERFDMDTKLANCLAAHIEALFDDRCRRQRFAHRTDAQEK